MNRKQRIIIYIGAVLLLCAFIYPEFRRAREHDLEVRYKSYSTGRGWLFAPSGSLHLFNAPDGHITYDTYYEDYQLVWSSLIVECAIVFVVCGVLYVATKGREGDGR